MSAGEINNTEALNEIRKAGRMFKAFEHVEKVLTVVAGLEQNERELRQSVATLQTQQKEESERLIKVKADIAKKVDAAERDAAAIRAEADSYSAQLKAQADDYAKVKKAESDAATGKIEAEVRERMDTATHLDQKIRGSREILAELESRITKAKAAAAEIAKGA